jgi:hypothetical protein
MRISLSVEPRLMSGGESEYTQLFVTRGVGYSESKFKRSGISSPEYLHSGLEIPECLYIFVDQYLSFCSFSVCHFMVCPSTYGL